MVNGNGFTSFPSARSRPVRDRSSSLHRARVVNQHIGHIVAHITMAHTSAPRQNRVATPVTSTTATVKAVSALFRVVSRAVLSRPWTGAERPNVHRATSGEWSEFTTAAPLKATYAGSMPSAANAESRAVRSTS